MDRKYIEYEIDEALKMFPGYDMDNVEKEKIVEYFSEIEKRPIIIPMIQFAVLFATLLPDEKNE